MNNRRRMKAFKKQHKIDWEVLATPGADDYKTNPNRIVKFNTIGLEKYGISNILGLGRSGNAEKYCDLINTFARMIIEGETFVAEAIHTIGKNTWSYDYRFVVRYFDDQDNNLPIILLMPDFDWDIDGKETKLKNDIIQE